MCETLVIINALSGGGAERSMNQICNYFQNLGKDVGLLAIESGPFDHQAFSGKITTLNRSKSLVGTASALLRFIRFVYGKPIRNAILNCELPELFGLFLPLRTQIFVVQHNPKPWGRNKILGKVVRKCLRFRSAIFVSVSNHMKIWPDWTSPAAVIPNPLSSNFQRLEQTTDSIKRLIYIGRLVSHQKNPEQIIRVAEKVGLPVKFIGSGNFKSALETLANTRGVQTEFTGYRTNPWEELDAGDVLIVPSLEEGDGLVVLEASIRGIPLLLSDIPDFRRFNFENKHYFSDDLGFIRAIFDHSNELKYFIVSAKDVLPIIDDRTIQKVGNSWKELLEALGG